MTKTSQSWSGAHRRLLVAGVLVLAGAGAVSAVTQRAWFVPELERTVVTMMAERLVASGLAAEGAGKAREGAQAAVSSLRDRLDSWGEAGVLARAPDVAHLRLPQAGQLHIDASARYFMCISIFEVMHARDAFAGVPGEERLDAAMAPASLTLAMFYLLTPYLAGGGTEARLQAFLTGADMEQVLTAIQNSRPLLATTYRRCRVTLSALIDG